MKTRAHSPGSFKTFYKEYARREGVTAHQGCSVEVVADAEKVLKLKFPASYRDMLLALGWMQVYSDIVYGLGRDATTAESVLEATVFARVNEVPQMPSKLIPVVAVGNGDHFCLDTSNVVDGDCPVVLWEHDHPGGSMQRPKKQSGTFIAWLEKLYDRDIH